MADTTLAGHYYRVFRDIPEHRWCTDPSFLLKVTEGMTTYSAMGFLVYENYGQAAPLQKLFERHGLSIVGVESGKDRRFYARHPKKRILKALRWIQERSQRGSYINHLPQRRRHNDGDTDTGSVDLRESSSG